MIHLHNPDAASSLPAPKPACGSCLHFEPCDDPTGILGAPSGPAGRCNWSRDKRPLAWRPWRSPTDWCCEWRKGEGGR